MIAREDKGIGLSHAVLEKVFPFHMAFNTDLEIVQLGKGIKKICKDLSHGSKLEQFFLTKAPDISLHFDHILEHSNNVFILEYLPHKVVLKGQMTLSQDDSGIMLFLCSPVVQDVSAVRSLGLTLNDFAIHDAVIDLLILLQTKNNTITDVRNMAERLKKESADRREAEYSSKSKSFFLANMSHEIRTPMVGTIGMLDLLERTGLNEKQQSYVDTAKSSAETLLALINDILDFSKIEAGKLLMEVVSFDVRRAIEDAVVFFAERAHKKGIELTYFISPDVPTHLQGDSVRFRQIITNLTENAIKFTDHGDVAVRVHVDHCTESELYLSVEVQDTGIGMPENVQKSVFDSFSQADGSTMRKFGGTGLGLAISKQLAEMMNGQISLKSEPGKGATFSFTSCFKRSEEANEAKKITPSVQGKRILVVDDNESSRSVICRYLKNWGTDYDGAASAAQGIKLMKKAAFEQMPFDYVLLDYGMPEMNGHEMAVALRKDNAFNRTRIVLMCHLSHSILSDQNISVDGFLTKPVRESSLYEIVTTVLSDGKKDRHVSDRDTRDHADQNVTIKGTVLLVDDNPVNRKVGSGMLSLCGASVKTVGSAYEAFEALSHREYDLIFMDCQMPQMDGFEATQSIRRREGRSKYTPIVALTALAMKGDREKCLEAGMDDYLAKPFTIPQLMNVLQKWLMTSSTHNEAVSRDKGLHKKEDAAKEKNDTETIDIKVLEQIRLIQRDGEPDIIKKLVHIYFDDAPTHISALQKAVHTGNADETWKRAHTLKSSSANLGATGLAELCKDLEARAKKNDMSNAENIFHDIETEFGYVIQSLKDYMNGVGNND